MTPTPAPPRTVRVSPRTGKAAKCEDEPHGCEIEELFHVLGKTYVLDILHLFLNRSAQPRRFVDLQNTLEMSPNTLSDRLKELVKAGLLSRTSYNEIPPRVDYEATEKARDLKPVFAALGEWADRHTLRPEPSGPKAMATVATS